MYLYFIGLSSFIQIDNRTHEMRLAHMAPGMDCLNPVFCLISLMRTILVGTSFDDNDTDTGAEQKTQNLSISPVKQIEIKDNLVSQLILYNDQFMFKKKPFL